MPQILAPFWTAPAEVILSAIGSITPVFYPIASFLAGMDKISRYQSYLLRFWQVSEGGRPALRISLENTQTRERHGFTDLEALLAFLRARIETIEAREDSLNK